MFAYYDPDADIAWLPTGDSNDVVSERAPDGLRDYDRTTRQLVAIEVWAASTRLPATVLAALPRPSSADTSFDANRKRLGTEPGTLADFEAAYGPVQPPDGEG